MDYFEYPFKGLPSPADTPYETPDFIRSKRSSRATAGSSRDASVSPPPLPPDNVEQREKARDGRYGAMDPRRFTPTLHASLVSEILNLRRELDSKNNLVENLEQSLSSAKTDNESLTGKLSENAKEVRKARVQVQQIERGTLEAVEGLANERDAANSTVADLRAKLEAAQKTARRQDDDAERTQSIWESEKERWENERRQMERRIHVTESRLRTVIDEMTVQQAANEGPTTHVSDVDESMFKDSGFGNESDTASVRSMTPVKHRRNKSSLSSRTRSIRNSTMSRTSGTPDPYAKPNGYSLADELGIDEEDEYDMDEFEHPDEELEYNEQLRRTMESRQSSVIGVDSDAKAKRVLGLTTENIDAAARTPTVKEHVKARTDSLSTSAHTKPSLEQAASPPSTAVPEATPRIQYVDTGYQPSPPPSPPRKVEPTLPTGDVPRIQEPSSATAPDAEATRSQETVQLQPLLMSRSSPSPISPPETPVVDGKTWPEEKRMSFPRPAYTTASTQTETEEATEKAGHTPKRDSLSPPSFVPSIAIHPPSSRPSSPRPYVLPPGTKNASTQASLGWKSRDAAVQTENIRVDMRPVKLPKHLMPGYLLPSPTFEEPPQPPQPKPSKRPATGGTAKIFTKAAPPPPPPLPSPPAQSPPQSSPELSRDNSQKDLRSMPLRAIPLPRPVLAPSQPAGQSASAGPLNRSSQYGVSKAGDRTSQLLDMDPLSDGSDGEDFVSDFDTKDFESSLYAVARPPQGRFGLSEPPKAVPEDKEISPERRPGTAESYGAAPAPSVSSSRAQSRTSHRDNGKAPAKLNTYKDHRSRSPSFGSVISSAYSNPSVTAPPFPIPTRSSSRIVPNSHSEGSQSPVPYQLDGFGNKAYRFHKPPHARPGSLRKVQSAAVIRNAGRKGSPPKSRRRRRRSPDLTPVQSMAFDSPAPTNFPIPELPTPSQRNAPFDIVKGSMDIGGRPSNAAVTETSRMSEETNLVDAIASTMVGEWMWKYIRKRKSFGVQEDFPIAEDGSVNTASHGSRHKRWVWLSPYERTIMWDSKQPASGTALLGKKGRKLAISSVLEVEDNTPLPKSPELRTAYDRSILILTPARALKFTAISAERHVFWMRALSFLAQPANLPSQIPPMPALPRPPQVPQDPAPTVKRHRSPSFGRATVRDSIRIAKGKRPALPHSATHPPLPETGPNDAMMALEGSQRDDSAEFPAIPRLYITTSRHQRKRSNTSPRLPAPLSSFRNFSTSAVPSTASSALHPGSTNGSSFRPNASASSKSGSRPDSLASPDRPNFFEAVGTVRMEAFVDPNMRDGVLYVPAPPADNAAQPRRRGDSNISQSTTDKRRAGYVFDENGFDPFKNF
ncbi:uncharacterized protein LTR77_006159 [Saxophila tyrrhenica]|uniref:Pleckstrin homology domain-containing protein n=1 Tax=Saxophila tyrrhenica TaxID=1690608 RepID=A0AAV9PBD1_9PEZI|nr:hypothetical protein LTR77_006159 [Saxophila tyrrhenica]